RERRGGTAARGGGVRGGWRAAAAAAGLACTAVLAGLSLGRPAVAASATTAAKLSIKKEVLVLAAGPGSSVLVFEEVALAGPAPRPWVLPLPYGARAVSPPSDRVRVVDGRAVAAKGLADASVVYRLPGQLGSVFVQDVTLPLGQVIVLAGPGVYPGVGTGLTLHGQTRIAGKTFLLFQGGSAGPGDVLHFSLTVGDPGRPWADALGVLLVVWLAAGAYLGSRRVMAVLRAPAAGRAA
ncbi:MAG: hypothetical protein K6V73_05370, partial [Firmicutes bacterium]|nr:hypothetical protein [Bacillota bacterium]